MLDMTHTYTSRDIGIYNDLKGLSSQFSRSSSANEPSGDSLGDADDFFDDEYSRRFKC